MESNYLDPCYKALRVFEGGNDDDPQDPGGRTSRGVIQREWDVFRRTHPGRPADVWKASEADIGAIYHDGEYWNGQHLSTCPSGPDEILFDYGVNSGPGRSQKVLRRCLHLTDNAPRNDVEARLMMLTQDQLRVLVDAMCDERLAFLRQLKTFPRFGKGWTARVAKSRTIAKHLVDAKVLPEFVMRPEPVDKTSAKGQHAEPTVAKNAVKAGTVAGGAGGGTTWMDWVASHPVETAVIVIGFVGFAYIVHRAIDSWHEQRKVAPPLGWTPPNELKPT